MQRRPQSGSNEYERHGIQRHPPPPHSKTTDIQKNRVLAPNDIQQVLGCLPGGDRQGGQMLLLAEKAAFDIAGLSVHC
ncbi:MAG: hypothetical protein DI539_31425 [Flavobacterium psychrophilum]|nr:MAG: hypothetical protein DI539_31425 [Flavobacterium psychrophilum]